MARKMSGTMNAIPRGQGGINIIPSLVAIRFLNLR